VYRFKFRNRALCIGGALHSPDTSAHAVTQSCADARANPCTEPAAYTCTNPGSRELGERCMAEPDGYWYGCCAYPYVCTKPNTNLAGAYSVCKYATMQPYSR